MLRAFALALALAALPGTGAAQQLEFNVISESFALSKSDVVEATQGFLDSRPIVRIKLSPAAATRMGEVTARNVGKVMQVVVDGRILTAPVIMSAITGGELIIQGNFTIEEAVELAKRFK